MLSAANCLALHIQMRRYISGQDVSHLILERNKEWWWNLPVTPNLVWIIGSVGFAAMSFLALRLCVRRADTPAPSRRMRSDARDDAQAEAIGRPVTTTGQA